MAKDEKQKQKKIRVKDVQRGVWMSEAVSEIKHKAETGKHRIRGCGTPQRFPNFDDLLMLPSQLTRMSIDTYREDCQTQTVLGSRTAKKPLVIETPVMISGMSYGALSKEAKIALAKATDIVGTSINNGEGGLLPEERANSYNQVVQILPSRMGFNLRKRLDIDAAARRVANYIQAMTIEATILAKAAGKTKLSSLEREDLRSLTLESCAMTGIPLVGSNYTFGEMFGFC